MLPTTGTLRAPPRLWGSNLKPEPKNQSTQFPLHSHQRAHGFAKTCWILLQQTDFQRFRLRSEIPALCTKAANPQVRAALLHHVFWSPGGHRRSPCELPTHWLRADCLAGSFTRPSAVRFSCVISVNLHSGPLRQAPPESLFGDAKIETQQREVTSVQPINTGHLHIRCCPGPGGFCGRANWSWTLELKPWDSRA